MDYTQLIQNLGTFLIASGVLGFVARSLFKYSLDKGLANYHVQLEKQVEAYKHELQLLTQQHQIQYSKLHSDRAEVIKQLYQKLIVLEEAMRSYMSPLQLAGSPTLEEKQRTSVTAAQEFFTYFNSNQIFFDPSINVLIGEMSKLYADAWNKFASIQSDANQESGSGHRGTSKEQVELWMAVWVTVTEKVPPLKQKLELEFRILLGVIKPAQ